MSIRPSSSGAQTPDDRPFLVVLGISQDAGFPQAGCARDCCKAAWQDPSNRKHVASLGLVDPHSGERWLFDATPDFREQLRMLDEIAPPSSAPGLNGILLTHAHIGHYTGLMFLGHESMGSRNVPVFVMPRMRTFLSRNGPWDQLVRYKNIELRDLTDGRPLKLNDRIRVTPVRVPHREEYTEVVGFLIEGPERSALYVPDIDKWEKWDRRIEDMIAQVDVAWLDGTFFAESEIPGRDLTDIPHPLIAESLQRFQPLPPQERTKVRFIHLNHTNPALRSDSDATRAIERAGCRVARECERFPL
jgi:pyrroloquinoline quinone biosynthesis protein B